MALSLGPRNSTAGVGVEGELATLECEGVAEAGDGGPPFIGVQANSIRDGDRICVCGGARARKPQGGGLASREAACGFQ